MFVYTIYLKVLIMKDVISVDNDKWYILTIKK